MGLRSACVRSVGPVVTRICAWGCSSRGCRRLVGGLGCVVGASPMTCQRAGVRGLTVACRVTLPPWRGLDYARPAVTLAPAFSCLGLVACQSATERL